MLSLDTCSETAMAQECVLRGDCSLHTHRLPQAQQITDLASKRGLMSAPYLPPEQSFQPQGYASKRILPRDTDDGTMPSDIKAAILDRISNDDPDGARLLLDGVDAGLSSEACLRPTVLEAAKKRFSAPLLAQLLA